MNATRSIDRPATRRRCLTQRRQEALEGYLLASPWFVGLALLTVIPFFLSIYYSFTNYDVFTRQDWVGAANYQGVLYDETFRTALVNTAIYTDAQRAANVLELRAGDVMTRKPVSIAPATLAVEALNIMEQRKITSLVVLDGVSNRLAGVVHLHDLWRTELV